MQPQTQIFFDAPGWLRLLAAEQSRPLAEQLIASLESSCRISLVRHDELTRQQFDNITSLVLYVITHPSFTVPADLSLRFVRLNHVISSIVALSSFKTTDRHLEMLRRQPGSLVKILTLYSARNSVVFDRDMLFAREPGLASAWYYQYSQLIYAGVSSEDVRQRLLEHFSHPPKSLLPMRDLQDAYFGPTYVDGKCDRIIKAHLNQITQVICPERVLPPAPGNRVALVTNNWYPAHSIYRILADMIAALRPRYHVTLVQTIAESKNDPSGFDAHLVLPKPPGSDFPDPRPLFEGGFSAVLFSDLGMSDESIFLANCRLAPVQVVLTGHPVSSYGAQTDYFISGQDVETPENPQRHYSERVVLLPGMGCTHRRPPGERLRISPDSSGPMIINCPAHGQKLNAPFLQTLARALRGAGRAVKVRFFAGAAITYFQDFLDFQDHVAAILGADAVEVVFNQPYEQYMRELARGHFSIDAYPFGGGNSVSDSLFAGVPMVCWAGDRWYNRIGGQMLRVAGLPELATESEEGFVECVQRMILNEPFRESMRQRVQAADLDGTLYRSADGIYLRKALDLLLSLRRSGDRTPICIQRDA